MRTIKCDKCNKYIEGERNYLYLPGLSKIEKIKGKRLMGELTFKVWGECVNDLCEECLLKMLKKIVPELTTGPRGN